MGCKAQVGVVDRGKASCQRNASTILTVFPNKDKTLKSSNLYFKAIFFLGENLKMWHKMGKCGNISYICGGELQACIPHTAFVRPNSRNSNF